jgi:hypothetical protein
VFILANPIEDLALLELEVRELGELVEGFKDGGFSGAHFGSVGVVAVVIAGEVKPTVREVKAEFAGEGKVEFFGAGAGVVDGNNDFSGGLHLGRGWECDDVGGAGVIHKLGVDGGYGGVVNEGYRKFAVEEGELPEGLDALG